MLLPGSASAPVTGGDRPHRSGRRGGGDRRASAGAGIAVSPVRGGVDTGAQPVPPSAGGSSRRRSAGGGVVDGAPVLLRPRRLQRIHVRRAGTGVDRTARPAQRRPASSAGGGRIGPGRTGRISAGRQVGHGGEPVDAAADDPRAPRSTGRRGGGPRSR